MENAEKYTNQLWEKANKTASSKEANYSKLCSELRDLIAYARSSGTQDYWWQALDNASAWVADTPLLGALVKVQTSNEDDEYYKEFILTSLLNKKFELV